MRRRLVLTQLRVALVLLTSLGVFASAAPALAQVVRDSRTGRPVSCPDPSVVDAGSGQYQYYLVCTSDNARDAFPIRGSDDLIHWSLVGYVFPAGSQPWWAKPSPRGRYWSPSLYRIDGRWVVYFAAQYNPARVHLGVTGVWTLGAATAHSLTGPWHSELLHYRGQFNSISRERESYGGVIDPSMVQDPTTGQMYLFWAEQPTSIWASELSADGLSIDPDIHQVMWARPGWEGRTASGRSVVEGPAEYYRDGWFYLFYSGASTWLGTYGLGVAVSTNPMQSQFVNIDSQPVLRSGTRWFGPGGASAPVTGPDGRQYIFYHAERGPNPHHISADRYLLMSRLSWVGVGGYYPLIGDGFGG